ncbi:MAG: short-chain dehydrogenase [Proteobacteria bacterium]|nr:MAG: short-chain dehydrogenase [Pseudomonadota bacterium]
MKRIVIFGATSLIAQETARCYAAESAALILVARSQEKLESIKGDLIARGASQVITISQDLSDTETHPQLVSRTFEAGALDLAILAHGIYGDQDSPKHSFEKARELLQVNFSSYVSLLTLLADKFEGQKFGSIVVISSVAGDRGRQSNYVYGAAKAGLSAFASGLRNRLFASGVNVITVKPGFVDTPMTAHMKKGPLFASARSVGAGIYRAVKSGRSVVYLPWFWLIIMTIIKLIPEPIFKRLRL